MNRTDVHGHFLPGLDDGCRDVGESLICLKAMAGAGYRRVFCTPHCGPEGVPLERIAREVALLQEALVATRIPIELRPGGELGLTPNLPEHARANGLPTYGHNSKTMLVDIWEYEWPTWATRDCEWLLGQGYRVVLAHPERMPSVQEHPALLDQLARMGLVFQGNLGPLGGSESQHCRELAERFLQDGRYFMLGSDAHRKETLAVRLAGLRRAEELVGAQTVQALTETNPGTLWV